MKKIETICPDLLKLAQEYQKQLEEKNPNTEAYDFEGAFLAGIKAAQELSPIYAIYDTSFEWDDVETSFEYVYFSTNKEDAIEYFNKYYGKTNELPDDKHHYEYTLLEIPNGWTNHRYLMNECPDIKELMTISNSKETD